MNTEQQKDNTLGEILSINLTDLVLVKYMNSNKSYVFKISDRLAEKVKVGDLAVVDTNGFTLVKVVNVLKKDINSFNYLNSAKMATKYIVDIVDLKEYEERKIQETQEELVKQLMKGTLGDNNESNTEN